MNKIILMGRLVRDPEVRYGASGNNVTSFSIAVERRFKREGQPDADFFNCVTFGKTGEFVSKYLKKGTKVAVEGEMQNNNYTNKEGQTVYGFQVAVNQVEFAESKNASSGGDGGNYPSNAGNQQEPPTGPSNPNDFMNIPDGIDDQLPF